MKTIIFDIDGTLTNMWPVEKSVLLYMTKGRYEKEMEKLKNDGLSDTYKIFLRITNKKIGKIKYYNLYNKSFLKLNNYPKLKKYLTVNWIKKNRNRFIFVYATGGQKLETEYALKQFEIIRYFDLKYSFSRNNCRFSKKTGVLFKKIKSRYKDSFLITDSKNDCLGAILNKIPVYLLKNSGDTNDVINIDSRLSPTHLSCKNIRIC